MTENLKVGVHETALQVPLFTELYGYGPFLGRRNRGTRDALYCRALTFFDGMRRIVLVVTDAVVTDDEEARKLRAEIVHEHQIAPNGIMFAGTHTHSGPAMSFGIGWGERSGEYLTHWRQTVLDTVREAIASEEHVTAYAGRAILSQKLGVNRVAEGGPTDSAIRWVRFCRPNGSTKALLHNHGMHGVVFGSKMLLVSADWMGEANRLIKERKLADTPVFLYGAAGDINTEPCCLDLEAGGKELERIGKAYVDDLERSLNEGGKAIELLPLRAVLNGLELPTVQETPEEMRKNAEVIREAKAFLADRFEEMAILAEQGETFRTASDFQVLRMGELVLYTFPGEPFYELGQRVMNESPYPFPLVCAVANGNNRYFPTAATYRMFPDGIASRNRGYGFYEIYQGAGCFKQRYRENIADYIVDQLLSMTPE